MGCTPKPAGPLNPCSSVSSLAVEGKKGRSIRGAPRRARREQIGREDVIIAGISWVWALYLWH